jgi:hypothetical protein
MKLIRHNQGLRHRRAVHALSRCNPPKIQASSAFPAVLENHFPGVSNTLEAVEKVIEESGLIGRERERWDGLTFDTKGEIIILSSGSQLYPAEA